MKSEPELLSREGSMRAHLIVLSSITTLLLLGGDLFAGEAEEKVMASCLVTNSATPAAYAACVAAGVTKNEVQKCITTPQQCYGPNNELRKLFCAVGIGNGCAGPQQAQLIRVFPFHGGCEVIYNTGIYFSPDCQRHFNIDNKALPTKGERSPWIIDD
jgi:hypothetical protein